MQNIQWKWKNFKASEIACKHCGELPEGRLTEIDSRAFLYDDVSAEHFIESMDALQELRELLGEPLVLTSAHRCVEHNANVGGSPNSQHLKIAFDCVCPREEQKDFVALAKGAGFRGVGTYPSRGFVHLDMGIKRQWVGQ